MDSRLRRLERLLGRNDPALLRERLRAGELPLDHLWLAAILGHVDAWLLVHEWDPRGAPRHDSSLRGAADDLAVRAVARPVIVAAAEAALPCFQSARSLDPWPTRAVSLAAELVRAFPDWSLDWSDLIRTLKHMDQATREVPYGSPEYWAARSARAALTGVLEPSTGWIAAALDGACRALGEEALVEAAVARRVLPAELRPGPLDGPG